MATQTPTPAPFDFEKPGGGSRVGLIAGVVVAVLVLAGGGFFLLRGGGDEDKDKGEQPELAAGDPAGDETVEPPGDPDTPRPGEGPEAKVGEPEGTGPGETKEPEVETPVTPPEPKEPEKVTLDVASSPKGAKVFVNDEKKPRGKTPLKLELEKGDASVKITLKQRGYKDREKTLTPDRDQTFDLRLEKKRRRPGGRPGGDSGKKDDPERDTEILRPTFGR
jgi:hypothetical protein